MISATTRLARDVIAMFAVTMLNAFSGPAHASNSAPSVKTCASPAGFYASAGDQPPFRPMLTMERRERIGAAGKTRRGPLDVEMSVALADVMIGKYLVRNTPVTRVLPHDSAAAYIFEPTGAAEQCIVSSADLKTDAFVRNWGYAAARLQLQQDDDLHVDFSSALDYLTRPVAVVSVPDAAPFGGAPCDSSNNHTHGLLVSPKKTGEKLGDYIFDLSAPRGHGNPCATGYETAVASHAHGDVDRSLTYAIHIPSKPKQQEDALQDHKHPSGLFWFHPHPHGYSAGQLSGGTTGLITVGKLCDYLEGVSCDSDKTTGVARFMMLKDAQIAPSIIKGEYDFSAKSAPDLCQATNKLPDGAEGSFWPNGECENRDDSNAPTGPKWIFTINGVQNPKIDFHANSGAGEIWRIANSSATVSYHLSLIPLAQAQKAVGPNPDPLCRKNFVVLSKDGAAVQSGRDQPASTQEKELLLMPGARVEIRVSDLRDFDWALVQEGVATGGDQWPRMILATVHPRDAKAPPENFDCKSIIPLSAVAEAATIKTSSGPRLSTAVESLRSQPGARATASAKLEKASACDPLNGRERLIQFVKNSAFGAPTDGWKGKDLFGVLAGVRDAGNTTVRYFRRSSASQSIESMSNVELSVIDPLMRKPFTPGAKDNFVPAFGNFPEFGNVCVTPDPASNFTETWVIENWTNEIHNFHLHQTRFFVGAGPTDESQDWLSDARYFDIPCDGWSYYDDADANRCMNSNDSLSKSDPIKYHRDEANGFVDVHIKNFFTAKASTGRSKAALTSAAHDSVPVPRGACVDSPTGSPAIDCKTAGAGCDGTVNNPYCRPGRITLRIPFNRSEQVGDFVYHCHILEHEDRGMMGIVRVKPPMTVRGASLFDLPQALASFVRRDPDPLANPPICTTPSR